MSTELHVPAAQRAEDLQLEAASSLLPLLIKRGTLHTTTADGQVVFFSDLDHFLQSKARSFRGGGDEPLFREFSGDSSFTELVATQSNLKARLDSLALEAGLPAPRPYNWRNYVGDAVRVVFDEVAQKAALHHGLKSNTALRLLPGGPSGSSDASRARRTDWHDRCRSRTLEEAPGGPPTGDNSGHLGSRAPGASWLGTSRRVHADEGGGVRSRP